MGSIRKKVLLIFCLLFLSVPIALLSLWRNQEIGHDLVILPSQPVILEDFDLWALNARLF